MKNTNSGSDRALEMVMRDVLDGMLELSLERPTHPAAQN